MKILFVHVNQPDYLAESLFHGLRTLLGNDCVDVPRYDSMYAPLTEGMRSRLRGYGFTLYGLLHDIDSLKEERFLWRSEFILPKYDLIVIADIWNLAWLVYELSSVVDPKKIVILDGGDMPALFPCANLKYVLKKKKLTLLLAQSIYKYKLKYFKRELCGGFYDYGLDKYIPEKICSMFNQIQKHAFPISFSIPEEKICNLDEVVKTKDFPKHIVDYEIADSVNSGFEKYVFTSEDDYYDDLQKSRFGITTKRSGWDCLRHYEVAANGCVLCFRNLDLKPKHCAPHGLNDSNSIIYNTYDELKSKIAKLKSYEYTQMQQETYRWARKNTTVEKAKYFLSNCFS